MITDPIADMLTRIRNAHLALHKEVLVPRSNLKVAIADILKEEGYINSVTLDEQHIKISLKYVKNTAALAGLKRISKPGRRVYVNAHQIPKVQNGLGICIVSTSRGLLEGSKAHAQKVGGELLCEVW
ncbi:30S ribosomal protein S8 [Desulfovibrio litoralis]|uniref:Small ribosomal subunit protein uS8 n=1 Tax=Desulfovibrio litoralis DSM 11393 TaxID=1121455 RepID=A0A1M7SDV5_9BACT|nr:30S ribosomal protein S8 [Desulfovibrio litoralis]SHN56680.1 SSU ribosomal protein S8P [Desulfovibrio litoralis DSM 11393]